MSQQPDDVDFNISTPPLPEYKIISLGYRCTVAGILKKLGLKHESFPFDWLISRLSVIQHCIQDDFREFLNTENYQQKHTRTFSRIDIITEGLICDEDIWANMYYQPIEMPNPIHTYHYRLALNHHNIVGNVAHYEYFKRCVQRLRNELNTKTSKMFVHITPVFTIDCFQNCGINIVKECHDFQEFLESNEGWQEEGGEEGAEQHSFTIRSLYFIMVLDNLESTPTLTILHENIDNPIFKHKIYLIKTNYNLRDAGETFMGDYGEEEELIGTCIRRFSV